ncbi:MAG TPA: hypothetical protein VGV59_12675 [Pyrinomonadaceae bacterium]|nr:hypothetical protein [Pyrinomonadaceae bacterium]
MKCVACGSTSLVEGELVDMRGGRMNSFKLSEVSKWKSMFGVGVRGVRAYGCVNCRHLQFAVEFTEEDVLRYKQFEGEQLGVLERIGAAAEGTGDA